MISPKRKWICAAAELHHCSALHRYSQYDLLQLVWPFNAAVYKSDTWGQKGGGERKSFFHLSLDILLHLFTVSSVCCQAAVTSELPQCWVSNKCFTGSVLCTIWLKCGTQTDPGWFVQNVLSTARSERDAMIHCRNENICVLHVENTRRPHLALTGLIF